MNADVHVYIYTRTHVRVNVTCCVLHVGDSHRVVAYGIKLYEYDSERIICGMRCLQKVRDCCNAEFYKENFYIPAANSYRYTGEGKDSKIYVFVHNARLKSLF